MNDLKDKTSGVTKRNTSALSVSASRYQNGQHKHASGSRNDKIKCTGVRICSRIWACVCMCVRMVCCVYVIGAVSTSPSPVP